VLDPAIMGGWIKVVTEKKCCQNSIISSRRESCLATCMQMANLKVGSYFANDTLLEWSLQLQFDNER